MAFRKRFKGGMNKMRRGFGSMRSRVSSGYRRARRSFGGGSPIRFSGFPMSRQINKILPWALIVAAVYMFVPAVKAAVNKIFSK